MLRHALTSLAALACLAAGLLSAAAAQATTTPGNAALNWAEAHATGHPFAFGGAGPITYDCSGTVMAAYAHADGIMLPHNTVAMVDSGLLVRTTHPQRGDIAMWGPVNAPSHAGFVTGWPDIAFGAENIGIRVGWYSWQYWPPTAFYKLR